MAVGVFLLNALRIFQIISYVYTAFAFVKYNVLPTMRLTAELAKMRFSSKYPGVNWPGRTPETRYHSKLISPAQEGVGPFHPLRRRDDLV